jgi:hypothetical protein
MKGIEIDKSSVFFKGIGRPLVAVVMFNAGKFDFSESVV